MEITREFTQSGAQPRRESSSMTLDTPSKHRSQTSEKCDVNFFSVNIKYQFWHTCQNYYIRRTFY